MFRLGETKYKNVNVNILESMTVC